MTEASESNYWISSTALSITLNAMGDADYIQANVASGAMIMCYMRNIDGLGYDAGHNYRRWKLIANPTYFSSTNEKYVYAAIPRKLQDNGTALIVFPSERVDIYGKSTTEIQLGSEDYYYIFLGGIISPSVVGGVLQNRTWTQRVDTGKLASDEAITAGGDNTWWIYNAVDDTVTFLKAIVHAVFDNLEAKYATVKNLILGGETLTGIANDETPKNSRVDVVTPDYLFGNSDVRYIRKDVPDTAKELITFLKGIAVGKGYGITELGDLFARFIKAKSVKSNDFRSGLVDGAGFGMYLDEGGKAVAEVDKLWVRDKATFAELEYRRLAFSAGDVGYTRAGAKIDYVEPQVDEKGVVTAYRCYFLADDGERRVKNDFRVGDQAACRTDNLVDRQGGSQTANRRYWRLVIRTGEETINGRQYHYVDLANEPSVEINGKTCVGYDQKAVNDVPQAGDKIIQLGSQTDKERQYAYIVYTSEGKRVDYAGIDDYNLDRHVVNVFSPSEISLRSDSLSIVTAAGTGERSPVVCDRGEWVEGLHAGRYDRFSYKGELWLCNVAAGKTTMSAPSEGNPDWIKQVARGERGTDGAKGEQGESAEVYRLLVKEEVAKVTAEGGLEVSLAYDVQHIKGGKSSIVKDKSQFHIVCLTDDYDNVREKPSEFGVFEFRLPDYLTREHRPSYFHVLLLRRNGTSEEVLEERVVNIFLDASSYVKAVGDLRETVSTFGKNYSTIKQTADAITLGVKNLLDNMKNAGLKIGDGKVVITANQTVVENTAGKDIAVFKEDGTLSAEVIDAKEIVTKGLKAGEIDVEGKAKIKNLVITGESNFEGELKGVTGSFQSLTCVGEDKKTVLGGIDFNVFNNKAMMGLNGDFCMKDSIKGDVRKRLPYFYATNLYCNTQFAHNARVCAVVRDEEMFLYNDGHLNSNGIRIALEFNHTTINGEYYNYYKIPMYSPGVYGGYIMDIDNPTLQKGTQDWLDEQPVGVPIDVIIFNCTKWNTYSFVGMGYGKEWTVINGSDVQSINICCHGNVHNVHGGWNLTCCYVNPAWLSPSTVEATSLGAGVMVGRELDMNWR